MDNEKNIYDYVITSMNNILDNGLNYYSDKNDSIYDRLADIKNYINKDFEFKVEEKESQKIETTNDNMSSVSDSKIFDDYKKKIMDIKISLLNLETDLPLYYKYDDSNEDVVDEEKIKVEIEESVEPAEEIIDDVKEEPVIDTEVHEDVFVNKGDKSLLDLFNKKS